MCCFADKLKQVEGSVSSVVGGDSGTDNSSNDTGNYKTIKSICD